MRWVKLAGKSLFCGGVITLFMIFVCLWAQNKTVSQILLAPLVIATNTFSLNNAAHEGTPSGGFLVIFGLILCVLFYSIISFFALLVINRLRKPAALK